MSSKNKYSLYIQTTKISYNNGIRLIYGKSWMGYQETGWRGTFGEKDCHRESSGNLNISTDEAFKISSGIPVRDYSNAERMLAATGFTPLLVNLQSMTPIPNADGGSKNCVGWKVEKAMHHFVHANSVTTDSSTDSGKEPEPLFTNFTPRF